MATGPRYTVRFRRRREGRTNYHRRIRLLAKGTPRLIVRRSNKYIATHITEYVKTGDKTLASARSSELKKLGWKHDCKNVPAAYLTGLLIGSRAIKAGIKETIFDLGNHSITKGSRLFSFLKGAVDSGLNIPHDVKMFPDEKRIMGNHISDDVTKNFEEVQAKLSLAGSSGSEASARIKKKILS